MKSTARKIPKKQTSRLSVEQAMQMVKGWHVEQHKSLLNKPASTIVRKGLGQIMCELEEIHEQHQASEEAMATPIKPMRLMRYAGQMTVELEKVLRYLKGNSPMNPTMERLLWDHPEVQAAAKAIGVENPQRPLEGRGQVRPPARRKASK